MNEADIIEGSRVPGYDTLFILGSYDKRITFYSQQVRALNLACALRAAGKLDGMRRFAVVGAGAAGLSLSAALALLYPDATIHVLESESRALHLQQDCTRRFLHPHIYEWPAKGSRSERANLPLLDWKAAPSDQVAQHVLQTFKRLQLHRNELKLKTLRKITGVERQGKALRLAYVDAVSAGSGSANYDAVFLTVGFGPERVLPGHSPVAISYWSDAAIAGAPKEGREVNRFLISGAGDGGLIDLAASALTGFDHKKMVDLVTRFSGIETITEKLLAIDRALAGGQEDDLFAAYDREIAPWARDSGLLEEVQDSLRPRAAWIFNTPTEHMLDPAASILNRLCAYLVIEAAKAEGRPVEHRVGKLVASDPAKPGRYEIAGDPVEADIMLIRHGAAKEQVFAPFEAIRAAYQPAHEAWLAEKEERRQPPHLTDAARSRLNRAIRDSGVNLEEAAARGSGAGGIEDTLVFDPSPEALPRPLRPTQPLLFREEETGALKTRFDEWARQGGMVTLVAPPRVGKSEVLREVAAGIARDRGDIGPLAILYFDVASASGPLRALYNSLRTVRALPAGTMDHGRLDDEFDEEVGPRGSVSSVVAQLRFKTQGRTLLTFVDSLSTMPLSSERQNELTQIFAAPVFSNGFTFVESQGTKIDTQLYTAEVRLNPFSPDIAAEFLVRNGQPESRARAAVGLAEGLDPGIFQPGVLVQIKYRYPPGAQTAPTDEELAVAMIEQASAIAWSAILGWCEADGSNPGDLAITLAAMALFKRAEIGPELLAASGLAQIPAAPLHRPAWLDPRASADRLTGFGLSAMLAIAEEMLKGARPGREQLVAAILQLGTQLFEQSEGQSPPALDEAIGWLDRRAPDQAELITQLKSLLVVVSAGDEVPALPPDEQEELAPAYLKQAGDGNLDAALAATALYARDSLTVAAPGMGLTASFLASADAAADLIAAEGALSTARLSALDTILYFGGGRFHAYREVLDIRKRIWTSLVDAERAALETRDAGWLTAWLSFLLNLGYLSAGLVDQEAAGQYLESAGRVAASPALDRSQARTHWLFARLAILKAQLAPDRARQMAALVEALRHAGTCLELAPHDTRGVRFYLRTTRRLISLEFEDADRRARVEGARTELEALFGPSDQWDVGARAQFASLMRMEARDAWDAEYRHRRIAEALKLLQTGTEEGKAELRGSAQASLVEARLHDELGHTNAAMVACRRALELEFTPEGMMLKFRLLNRGASIGAEWEEELASLRDSHHVLKPDLRLAIRQFRQQVNENELTGRGYGRVLLWIVEREWRAQGSIFRHTRTQVEEEGRDPDRISAREKLDRYEKIYNARMRQLGWIEGRFGPSVGLTLARFGVERQYRRLVSIVQSTPLDVQGVLKVLDDALEDWPDSHILSFTRAEYLRYVWDLDAAIEGLRKVRMSATSGNLRRRATLSLAKALHAAAVHQPERAADREEAKEKHLREARTVLDDLIGAPDVAEDVAILSDHVNLELGESVDWASLETVYDRVVGEIDEFPNSFLKYGDDLGLDAAPRNAAEALLDQFADADVLGFTGLLYLRRAELGIGNQVDEDLRRSLAFFRAEAYMERSFRGTELPVTSFRIGRALLAAAKRQNSVNPIAGVGTEGKKDQLALAGAKFTSAQHRTVGIIKEVSREYQRAADACRTAIEAPPEANDGAAGGPE